MFTCVEWYDWHLLIFIVSHYLDKICNNILLIYLHINSHHHLWIKIYRRLLSLFMTSLLLHMPTHKMPNLLDTYNTYIEYIEEASFLQTYNAKQRIREISNMLRLKRSRDRRM
jgi:hypothetical protein